MNPRVEKLKVALAAAKETIKTLKDDLRTLKANHKAELKAAKGGAVAKPAKVKKAVKKPAVKKIAKKAVKKVAVKKAPRAKKTAVAPTPATDA